MNSAGDRLLVVSHPSVVPVNQAVYLALLERGWDLLLVVPSRWHHEYSRESSAPHPLPGLENRICAVPVALPGKPQRHFYLRSPKRFIDRFRPDILFMEEESYSLPALQWGSAARRARLPFGVQSDENLDRVLPAPARMIRNWVLGQAAFVAARSPTAERRAKEWGAKGQLAVVPHAVPLWDRPAHSNHDIFTVGFAGRLVPEKGVWDLVEAVRLMAPPVRLLFVGDGPLRSSLQRTDLGVGTIDVRTDMSHGSMPEAYAEMDVLVLPSRTMSTWAEQFGRVLVEALSCGVPVVGSDSGEIPWVIQTTGGGHVYSEGDVTELARSLTQLRSEPEERERLAARGRASVERIFRADACAEALSNLLRASMMLPTP